MQQKECWMGAEQEAWQKYVLGGCTGCTGCTACSFVRRVRLLGKQLRGLIRSTSVHQLGQPLGLPLVAFVDRWQPARWQGLATRLLAGHSPSGWHRWKCMMYLRHVAGRKVGSWRITHTIMFFESNASTGSKPTRHTSCQRGQPFAESPCKVAVRHHGFVLSKSKTCMQQFMHHTATATCLAQTKLT